MDQKKDDLGWDVLHTGDTGLNVEFATESFSSRRSRLFIWNFFWKFQIQQKNPGNPVNPV